MIALESPFSVLITDSAHLQLTPSACSFPLDPLLWTQASIDSLLNLIESRSPLGRSCLVKAPSEVADAFPAHLLSTSSWSGGYGSQCHIEQEIEVELRLLACPSSRPDIVMLNDCCQKHHAQR